MVVTFRRCEDLLSAGTFPFSCLINLLILTGHHETGMAILILEMRQTNFGGSSLPKVTEMGTIGPMKIHPVPPRYKAGVQLSIDQSVS